MEDMLFNVHFNWSGKDIEQIASLSEVYRDVANANFVDVRNKACDALNDKYDEWNKEFDEMCPGIIEDRSNPNSEYMKYICKKQNEVLSTIHDEHGLYKLHSDENAVIIGDLIGTDSSVFITVTPANDEAKKICK